MKALLALSGHHVAGRPCSNSLMPKEISPFARIGSLRRRKIAGSIS
jgi:hypothetical protein